MKNKLIVSLDVPDLRTAERLIDELSPLVEIFKIGSQLFTATGPKIIDLIHKKERKVFLDLKFYDIPNTVSEAARAVTRLGVFMFNVHSTGGSEMMQAAAEAAGEEAEKLKVKKPLILGVTLLTSFNQQMLAEMCVRKQIDDYVLYLAQQAKKAGLEGIVASAKELRFLRENLGESFIMVVPGIRLQMARLAESARLANSKWQMASQRMNGKDDQKRVSTPAEAINNGADYIVVGRPIIAAKSPTEAAKQIIGHLGGHLAGV